MSDTGRDRPLIVGLGEVLWDMLPDGRQLGGAPANVAFHAAALGGRGVVASCVGDDELGGEIRRRLRDAGLDDAAVAVDPSHPTGTVTVELDAAGEPTFTIHENVAWDFVPFTDAMRELARRADAVCFGSLAQRSAVSRETIRRCLAATRPECLRICDVNLRQSYFSREVLVDSFRAADVVKLNDEELPVVAELLGLAGDGEAAMGRLLAQFSLGMVILTCGQAGSVVMTPERTSRRPASKVDVVDSVGAGDAFTAAAAMGLLLGIDLASIHERAERVAGYVCTQPGATPALPQELRFEAS